ncbi:Baeyer-Villiger monooxygenase [Paraconexibacter sp. AEG42_29]|uniref:Baeyer-Villiger monooxygenase n=1 Tax=Paraconexibacter sp. AEG42_29 TaxID=2997339 RepID=A0AAU7AUE3_9ACTN
MTRSLSVVIIGAGFGGIAAAIAAREAGVEDITLLERADRVGGVWHHNTYPGIACDVPSHLYEFSFAPNPDWSRRYSPGHEIRDYAERLARDHGVLDRVRFGAAVEHAAFDDDSRRWSVRLAGGETLTADVVITAVGQLHEPAVPALPGIETFAGRAFHSAEWDHDHDLRGRRVAVVGTGASAIQFVPRVAEQAAATTVFQRSAPWVIPKADAALGSRSRALYRRVPLPRVYRRLYWRLFESLVPLFTLAPERRGRVVATAVRGLANAQRHIQLRGDRALLAATRPTSEPGCKRLCITSEWYPTMRRPDVELITEPIREVVPEGVVGADGTLHRADTIIYGTGFRASELLAPMTLTGRGGVTLRDAWSRGAEAFLGLTIPAFPNLFLVYGPSTNHGTGSVIATHEAQMAYLRDALRLLSDGNAEVLEVREVAHARFQAEMAERTAKSVWATGCSNWYVNAAGRVTNNWPGPNDEYRRRTATLNEADYHRELPDPVA